MKLSIWDTISRSFRLKTDTQYARDQVRKRETGNTCPDNPENEVKK